MRRHFIFLILLVLGTLASHAQYSVLNGDLNHDGKITVEDMALMANIIVEKSPGETIESETELGYGVPLAESATLLCGDEFNNAIKKLVNPSTHYSNDDNTIKKITFRKGHSSEGILVSCAESLGEACAVYNAETQEVDIYVAANKLVFPESCYWMFRGFRLVSKIDWSVFGNNIDTSNVTNMAGMFGYCSSLTSLDLSNFDTSKVTDMGVMFCGCPTLTSLDISNFDTGNVTDMSWMFMDCSSLTSLDLSNFDTSKVTKMFNMFWGCSSLTSLDISNFDSSNVTDMSDMFRECSALSSLDVSNFNTCNVLNMEWMFVGCSSLTSLDVSNFNTSNVDNMGGMFEGCTSLTSLDVSHFDTRNVTNMRRMFLGTGLTSLDVSNFDTSNVTNMVQMFSACSSLTSLDLSNFDTGNVHDMCCMFQHSKALILLDISNFDTSNVTDMSYMFYGCSSLTSLDLSNFNTGNVTDMSQMFYGCFALTSLDVSNFNTSKVTSMFLMFEGCTVLTSLDVSNFDTNKVLNMSRMFGWCPSLTSLDLSNFDTSNVTDMSLMFYGCSALTSIDLSNFDTKNVADMSEMFRDCSMLYSLKLGYAFAIMEGCSTGSMLLRTPNDAETPYCTISCTESTQIKLQSGATDLNAEKILWNIIDGQEIHDDEIKANAVSLNFSTLTISVPYTKVIKSVVLPENALDKNVIWSSSDPSVATVVDGKVTAVAVGTAEIKAALASNTEIYSTCEITVNDDNLNGYEYVDLGIVDAKGNPIYWATCNIGATKPEGNGLYFTWGGTEGYTWSHNFDINDPIDPKYAKDGLHELLPEDDAAHVIWQGDWRMPTKEDIQLLRDNCNITWTTINGVKGMKFVNKTDSEKFIFLPACGVCQDGACFYPDSQGFYWTSSLWDNAGPEGATFHFIYERSWEHGIAARGNGLLIRPVYSPQKNDPFNGHAYVDLGMVIDGKKVVWATCNVGAETPEDYGLYFAWGDTEGHSSNKIDGTQPDGYYYNWANMPFNNGSSSYNSSYFDTVKDEVCPGGILAPEYDAAHVNWQGDWRMPTRYELTWLHNNCTWTYDSTKKGYTVTSKTTGASIFLPSAGSRFYSDLDGAGSYGFYWSSSLYTGGSGNAYCLSLRSNTHSTYNRYRCYGHSVRPVCVFSE